MVANQKEDILKLISEDAWMMTILTTVKSLNLPDWWVCAGFVRSKVWDTLHNYNESTPLPDIDVIYFDPLHTDETREKRIEQGLSDLHPGEPWSVKNQARMHLVNKIPPYDSSVDAISKFPETATALGVKLDANNRLVLATPHGVEDVFRMVITPTDYFKETKERIGLYRDRVAKKDWQTLWKRIKIEEL